MNHKKPKKYWKKCILQVMLIIFINESEKNTEYLQGTPLLIAKNNL